MNMTRVLPMTAAAALAALLIGAVPSSAQEGHGGPIPARVKWSFAGTFGHFDTAQPAIR
jgi:ubiquinol-cytochrome c reductase cytochrome c1 subunit